MNDNVTKETIKKAWQEAKSRESTEWKNKTTPQNIHFDCPQCKSNQTSSFQMVYSQGTNTGRISAGGITSEGDFAFTGGTVKSQSVLAGKLAPPKRPVNEPINNLVILALSGIILMLFTGITNSIIIGALACLISFGTGVYFYSQYVQKQMPEYIQKMDEWSKSMICFRCGYMWIKQ
jgi:hypothetical protein